MHAATKISNMQEAHSGKRYLKKKRHHGLEREGEGERKRERDRERGGGS